VAAFLVASCFEAALSNDQCWACGCALTQSHYDVDKEYWSFKYYSSDV